jgi:hypothetical protein
VVSTLSSAPRSAGCRPIWMMDALADEAVRMASHKGSAGVDVGKEA